MKINGFPLLYNLGFTEIEGGSADPETIQDIIDTLDTLKSLISKLSPEASEENFIDILNSILNKKVEAVQTLGQDTPDDPSDDVYLIDPKYKLQWIEV